MTTPRTGDPSGSGFSKGYPFTWVVIGHIGARPARLL